MNKLKILIFILVFLLFSKTALAQSPDTMKLFAEVQKELAGEASEWRFREVMPTSGFFYHTPISPQDVLATEDNARLHPVVDTDTILMDDDTKFKLQLFKDYYDEDSGDGTVYRAFGGWKQFSGDYKLKSNATTELGIIRDIYEQITSRVARYAVPSKDNPASCLAENTGVCRHMATILQESLEDYGIKSEQIFSETHTWVRVTLSDPKYAGKLFDTFDLDPTWYAQPIPLPPRTSSYISDSWKKMMMAIVPSGSPTPTLTPTVTPTPTITPTPSPTISVTQEPTSLDEGTSNSGNSGSSNSSGDSDCPGCLWTVPR
ncbi:hypothetical protein A2773_04885 [Candidatus Gottesmanbacteria bacterium RIFCSPHIGHO2_01_FULL_39_10]|uniref:Transglutaminase-like domain-containing protein n=1 Tax=Candidatus Gottesmanbacteria bacterium RIFCSPHIGHO2_01_FULL_39_10 TaxID=1798375 RepID=A0A1F5ZST8_9BACT|nr:MAG: hypothetical protein A2773_04885 [Candidatus Gottesmanbacteria bacterium RIFCSPHIGHO2_01_FULL_39_10]